MTVITLLKSKEKNEQWIKKKWQPPGTCHKIEPEHDKTNKIACAPSKDSDQLGHPPSLIWGFAVCMKKPWALSHHKPHSEDSDQTGWIPRLIWVFAGHTGHFVVFVMRWLRCLPPLVVHSSKWSVWEVILYKLRFMRPKKRVWGWKVSIYLLFI